MLLYTPDSFQQKIPFQVPCKPSLSLSRYVYIYTAYSCCFHHSWFKLYVYVYVYISICGYLFSGQPHLSAKYLLLIQGPI